MSYQVDHTAHDLDHTDQEGICPEISTAAAAAAVDHAVGVDVCPSTAGTGDQRYGMIQVVCSAAVIRNKKESWSRLDFLFKNGRVLRYNFTLTLLGLQSRFGDNSGQTTLNLTGVSPKRDWSSKRVKDSEVFVVPPNLSFVACIRCPEILLQPCQGHK